MGGYSTVESGYKRRGTMEDFEFRPLQSSDRLAGVTRVQLARSIVTLTRQEARFDRVAVGEAVWQSQGRYGDDLSPWFAHEFNERVNRLVLDHLGQIQERILRG